MKREDYLLIRKPQIISRRLALRCSWMFQQDNDPKYTSKVLKEWIKQARIEVLE